MKNTTFPEVFQIGAFDKTNELPLLLPSDFGICLSYSYENDRNVHNAIEQLVLNVAEQIPTNLLNLAIIDLDIRSHFPNLIQLTQSSNTLIIRDLKDLSQLVRRLTSHAREIDSLLGQDYKTLSEFNEENPRPEPYWLIAFANFPQKIEADLPYLESLIENADRTGIYFVASLENEYFEKLEPKDQSKIKQAISFMPVGESQTQSYTFKNVHQILESGITNFGFRWVEQSNLKDKIATLNQKIKKSENPDDKMDFLQIQIGWKGRDPFYLTLGDSSGIFNGLLAGAVGTGKSTLLNNIIVQIAQNYSPDEIRLFLLDYKEGVEFGIYQHHPNVQVLSLDNLNFQFALEKIRDFEGEIRSRSQLFEIMTQQNGRPITHIEKYNAIANQRLPRLIMIIDEVRQLFRGRSWQEIKDLQDSITRVAQQGRAYGLHLLFCSQSFNGVNLGEAMKQMQLRVSFRLADFNECMYVMGTNNPTPTELNKHEIIYNTEFGSIHNLAHNHRVKTDVFVREDDILPILQQATQKYKNHQLFTKEVRRMGDSLKAQEAKQEPERPLTLKEQNDKKMADLLALINKKNG